MTINNHPQNNRDEKQTLVGREVSFYKQWNIITKDAVDEKREFDKKFFYVISSFFAFSILLIQFIKTPNGIAVLLVAWYSDLCALIFHLFAHLTAEKSHLERRERYVKMDEKDDQEREEVLGYIMGILRSPWVKATKIMEIVSYISFISAIFFLLWFVYLNLI